MAKTFSTLAATLTLAVSVGNGSYKVIYNANWVYKHYK